MGGSLNLLKQLLLREDLTKKLMTTECIAGYARLLENMLNFPSETFLPSSISQVQVLGWKWSVFRSDIGKSKSFIQVSAHASTGRPEIVFKAEQKFMGVVESTLLTTIPYLFPTSFPSY